MLLKHLKVDRQCLLDDSIVLFGDFAEVDADTVCFFELAKQSLLHFPVLLELALFAKFGQLVM